MVRRQGLLDAAAVDIAAAIRAEKLTAREVIDVHVDRIRSQNGPINAVVVDRFDAARAEADALDARIRERGTSDLPPLAGVPCTIKEFFAVEGMPQTGGLFARRDHRAQADATIVRRVRDAGAIVVGITNVPEGGLWMETENRVYGRTSNPWNTKRTAGGSSGGEGAIVAVGGAAFGIGSDIGGSIRIPAAFCGTVGHKPTGRMIPNSGQFPTPDGDAGAFLTPGPLARRVRDVVPILRAIAGPDGIDDGCRAMEIGDPASVDLRGMTVVPVPSVRGLRVAPVMQDAVMASARALEKRGANIRSATLPELENGVLVWAAMLDEVVTVHYDAILGDDGTGTHAPVDVVRELLFRLPFGRSRFTFPALTIAVLDKLVQRLPKATKRFIEQAARLRARIAELLGDRGVLLHPPYTRPAPRHGGALLTPLDPACTAIFNVLEMPGTVVPTGFDESGLPVAVQILSVPGADHVTLAAAQVVEDHLGGWQRATVA
jgi:fatty acid amide hydrolase 2